LAKGLKNGKTTLIGVLSYRRHDSYHDRILHGIYEACSAQGYTPIVAHIGGDIEDREICMRMVDYHICGLVRIVGRIDADQTAMLAHLQTRFSIPCVIVDDMDRTHIFDCVANDSHMGAKQAVEHLLSLGYRRIGHLSAGTGSLNASERERGFRDALTEGGLSVDESLIQGDSFIHNHSYPAMNALLDQRPDAVFAASDQLAATFRELARQRGIRVPGDMALVGFGDLEASGYSGLSTIDQQPELLATRAIQCLDERWENPERPLASIIVPTRLIARSSSTGDPIDANLA
jgi:LacI family transcriptional regulator